jgi:hypothetical protein
MGSKYLEYITRIRNTKMRILTITEIIKNSAEYKQYTVQYQISRIRHLKRANESSKGKLRGELSESQGRPPGLSPLR